MPSVNSLRSLCVAIPLLSACTTSATLEVQLETGRIIAASRSAQTCRSTIAAQARYQVLARHMPLVVVFQATLTQMTDTSLAGDDEIAVLGVWLDDLRDCRRELENVVLADFPLLIVPLTTGWNNDDATFVQLAHRKPAWGQAVMELRTHRAEMLHGMADEVLQESKQISVEKQAETSRRIALFNALTNLVP